MGCPHSLKRLDRLETEMTQRQIRRCRTGSHPSNPFFNRDIFESRAKKSLDQWDMIRAIVGHVKTASGAVWIEHAHLYHRTSQSKLTTRARLINSEQPSQRLCRLGVCRNAAHSFCSDFNRQLAPATVVSRTQRWPVERMADTARNGGRLHTPRRSLSGSLSAAQQSFGSRRLPSR